MWHYKFSLIFLTGLSGSRFSFYHVLDDLAQGSQTKINNKTHFSLRPWKQHVQSLSHHLNSNNLTISSRSCSEKNWQTFECIVIYFISLGKVEVSSVVLYCCGGGRKRKRGHICWQRCGRALVGFWGLCVGGRFVAGKREALLRDKAWRPQRPTELK